MIIVWSKYFWSNAGNQTSYPTSPTLERLGMNKQIVFYDGHLSCNNSCCALIVSFLFALCIRIEWNSCSNISRISIMLWCQSSEQQTFFISVPYFLDSLQGVLEKDEGWWLSAETGCHPLPGSQGFGWNHKWCMWTSCWYCPGMCQSLWTVPALLSDSWWKQHVQPALHLGDIWPQTS